jgi:hypothetical protein
MTDIDDGAESFAVEHARTIQAIYDIFDSESVSFSQSLGILFYTYCDVLLNKEMTRKEQLEELDNTINVLKLLAKNIESEKKP